MVGLSIRVWSVRFRVLLALVGGVVLVGNCKGSSTEIPAACKGGSGEYQPLQG